MITRTKILYTHAGWEKLNTVLYFVKQYFIFLSVYVKPQSKKSD